MVLPGETTSPCDGWSSAAAAEGQIQMQNDREPTASERVDRPRTEATALSPCPPSRDRVQWLVLAFSLRPSLVSSLVLDECAAAGKASERARCCSSDEARRDIGHTHAKEPRAGYEGRQAWRLRTRTVSA